MQRVGGRDILPGIGMRHDRQVGESRLLRDDILLATGDGGEGQTAESFVVGIRPKEGERMRPFWLDVPPRMYDTVTAHPHAVTAKQ